MVILYQSDNQQRLANISDLDSRRWLDEGEHRAEWLA